MCSCADEVVSLLPQVCSCCKEPGEATATAGQPRSNGVNTQTEIRELSCVRKPSEGPKSSAGPSCSRLSPGPVAPPSSS